MKSFFLKVKFLNFFALEQSSTGQKCSSGGRSHTLVPAATQTHRRPDEDFPRQQGGQPAGGLWPYRTDLQQAGHRARDLRESVVHTVEEQN